MVESISMDSELKHLTNSTFELTITIPWEKIKATTEQITAEFIKNTEVKGFRKGKAPKKLAKEKIDKEKVFQEAVRQTIPNAYLEAIKKNSLNPITNPKIEAVTLDENKDWVFKATSCEQPEVKLGDYKDQIKKITAKSKIVIPGNPPAGGQPPSLEEILSVLLQSVSVEIPELLIENEVNRLLAQTLDEVKALGLTLEQYLSSSGKTPDSLRAEYTQKAMNDLKLEFVLDKISEEEKITVTDKDIDEAIEKTQDPKAKASLAAQRYLLAVILRRQKTLDFLKNL